jgi:hypothetical protein
MLNVHKNVFKLMRFTKGFLACWRLAYKYDPETKRQSSELVGEISPRPKKLKFPMSRIKIMLIIFLDSQGVVHKELVQEGKTVNEAFYKGVMDRLLKCIRRVRPAAFCCRDFFLFHDNVSAHKVASFCQFFTPKNVTNLYQSRILQIFLRQDIFCSPSWKWSKKVSTLRTLLRSKKP